MLTSVNATNAAYAGGMSGSNTAAANKAALQAALNTNRQVHIPFGSYYIEPGLVKKANGQIVFGQGPHQTILIQRGSGDLFSNGGKHRTGLRDIQISGDTSATGGFVYAYVGTGSAPVSGGLFRNVNIANGFNGFYFYGVNNVDLEAVQMAAMRGDYGVLGYGDSAMRTDLIGLRNVTYSAHSATRTSRGTALALDGFVHSVELNAFRAVNPFRGILVTNTPGMPWGSRPSFILGDKVQVDYPHLEAMVANCGQRIRMSNSYFHGSANEAGIAIGAGVIDFSIAQTNVTGHAKTGLYSEGQDVDVLGCRFDWNGQAAYATHHGILLGPNARRTVIVGGGARGTAAAWGIAKDGAVPATDVLTSNIDHHGGVYGSKNW